MVEGSVMQSRVHVTPVNMVNRRDAATALGRSVKTLADWSTKGLGPRPVPVGGRIFYHWSEVQAFARGEAA